MILLQAITPQGAISADWMLVIMVGVVGMLIITICSMVASHFIGTLKEIRMTLRGHELRMDGQDEKIRDIELENVQTKADVKNFSDKVDPHKTAELIWIKIKAAQGGN
jgi:hypothetical protein